MAANADSTPPPSKLTTVTATEAKNSFGAVLDRAIVDGPVAISKHDEVRAVLLSVRHYEALLQQKHDPLLTLASEFSDLVQAMQTPAAAASREALFDAGTQPLGAAAVAAKKRD